MKRCVLLAKREFVRMLLIVPVSGWQLGGLVPGSGAVRASNYGLSMSVDVSRADVSSRIHRLVLGGCAVQASRHGHAISVDVSRADVSDRIHKDLTSLKR